MQLRRLSGGKQCCVRIVMAAANTYLLTFLSIQHVRLTLVEVFLLFSVESKIPFKYLSHIL